MTIRELYTEIGGNYERVRKLLQMDALIARFLQKLPDDRSFDKLLEGYNTGDRKLMFEGAHAMKGLCGNLGLDSLGESAKVVTEECREGNTPTMSAQELAQVVEKMKDDYARTLEAIRRFSDTQ